MTLISKEWLRFCFPSNCAVFAERGPASHFQRPSCQYCADCGGPYLRVTWRLNSKDLLLLFEAWLNSLLSEELWQSQGRWPYCSTHNASQSWQHWISCLISTLFRFWQWSGRVGCDKLGAKGWLRSRECSQDALWKIWSLIFTFNKWVKRELKTKSISNSSRTVLLPRSPRPR